MTIHTHKHTRGDYSFGLTPHGPTGLTGWASSTFVTYQTLL